MTHFLSRAVAFAMVVTTAVATPLAAQQFLEFVGGPPSVNPYTGKYIHDHSVDYLAVHDTLLAASYGRDSVIYVRSTDGGLNWSDSHLRMPFADDMASEWLVSTDNGTLLAVRNYLPTELRRSTDGGWTWIPLSVSGVDWIFNVSAGDGDTVFMTARGYDGWRLYRSVDDGAHWGRVAIPYAGIYVYRVAQKGGRTVSLVPIQDPTGVYRLRPFLSDNGGTSWRRLDTPDSTPDGVANSIQSSIVIDSTGVTFLRSWTGGVYRLRSDDSTWISASIGLPPNTAFTCMAMSSDGALYIGTNGPGVFHSTDQGESWTGVDQATINAYVYSLGSPGGTIVANVFRRIYRLDGPGGEWRRCDIAGGTKTGAWQLAAASDDEIYFGSDDGIVSRTSDGGASWIDCAPVSASNVRISIMALDASGRLYASVGKRVDRPGTGAGLLRSTDSGMSWTALNRGLPTTNTGEFVITDRAMFLATSSHGLYRSTDNGGFWTAVGPGIPSPQIQTLFASKAGVIFAGTSYNGLWRSTDQGATWQDANAGLEHAQIWWCSENVPTGTLFITATNTSSVPPRDITLYRSTDGGLLWHVVSGIASPSAERDSLFEPRAIRCNQSGAAFALTYAVERKTGEPFLRLFRSIDDGLTWAEVDSTANRSGWWMFFTPDDRLLIPAAGGLYRSVTSTKLSAPSAEMHRLRPQVSVEPGGAQSLFTVHYALPATGETRVAVYDALGRHLRTLLHERIAAGTHRIALDASDLPVGVCYVRVECDAGTAATGLAVAR